MILPMKLRQFSSILCFSLIMSACGGDEDMADTGSPAPSTRVETLLLTTDAFEDVIELTGTVEAVNDATLSAQTAGTVVMLSALGTLVDRDEAVAQLDQALLEAALEQAEAGLETMQAQLDLAEDTYTRLEPLYRDSIFSALEFKNVLAQRRQAQAAVRQAAATATQAREQFANTTIRAPFAGTVEAHLVERGEQVAPGVPVARIVDTRRVKISVGVPERYAGDIAVGTEVSFGFAAYGGTRRTGTVTFAGSAINPENRTFAVEAEVSNKDGRLKPAMIAEVFVTRQRLDSVLIIPRAAVVRDEAGHNVYTVSNDDRAQSVSVTLGPSHEGRVIVESGLEPGTEVIVLGHTTVTDGDRVAVDARYTALDKVGVPIRPEASVRQ